ncbi:MAG: signal peptidase II [Oscillospiraceae bacterium]
MTILCLIAIAVLIIADQLIKLWAMSTLMPIVSIPIIKDVFHLTYVANHGAAFSILQGKTFFLIAITSIALGVALYLLLSKKIQNKCLIISLVLIISGGVGNLIDRIRLGFVVDYLDFRLINFPVFNFADCCVVIGTALVLIYVFFIEPKEKKMKDMEN